MSGIFPDEAPLQGPPLYCTALDQPTRMFTPHKYYVIRALHGPRRVLAEITDDLGHIRYVLKHGANDWRFPVQGTDKYDSKNYSAHFTSRTTGGLA